MGWKFQSRKGNAEGNLAYLSIDVNRVLTISTHPGMRIITTNLETGPIREVISKGNIKIRKTKADHKTGNSR